MTLYRYTHEGEGIFQALKNKAFDFDDEAYGWLDVPPVYKDKRFRPQAWFTEEGNFMFQELILPIIERHGITPKMEVAQSMPGVPIYADDYQVIVNREM